LSDKAVPIADITKLGMFFGRISEVHIQNLKNFPWIFFNDLTEVTLDYSVASKKEDSSMVSYGLVIAKENDNLEKRYKAIEDAVRALFWKEVHVKIFINHKEVFKSD
jgi:hypothetical protein